MDLEPFGDAAWRVRLDAPVDARALLAGLRALAGVVDAVVGEQHAAVTFDPAAVPDEASVRAAVARASEAAAAATGAAPRAHSVRVRYDGDDLPALSRQLGLSTSELVSLHGAGDYVVAAIGFQPGFAYLRGLDPRLVLARRATPRLRVPALSVAMAGPYSGIYPFESPGGWHLLGTAVGFAPFDARTGAALALGDHVRFVPEPQ